MAVATSKLNEILDAYIAALRRHLSVERVILFGSYARDAADEHSDIDIAVVSPDFGKDVLADLQLLAKLRRYADYRIQALAYTPDQVARPMQGTFLHEILTTGKTVYPRLEEEPPPMATRAPGV